LPTSISKSSDLTIQLDGMLSSADSVYLLVIASNEYVQTAVGGNASSITLTSSQLSVLPTVSDGSAFIEVVPFNIELENINGKNYAFVKEQAVVATVNIN